MRACGVLARVTPIEDAIRFAYFHPLSPPRLTPPIPKANASLAVEGEVVLRFGFVEGDAIVHAERAVHDPQGGDLAAYRSNGSSAGTLAVVLNQHEAEQIAGGYGPDAGETVRGLHGAEVVVVKRGSAGALVHRADRPPVAIPAYPSERVFKIGSGDVFSAVFAHHWAERNLDPADAAELASRAVARYVETRSLPSEPDDGSPLAPAAGEPGRIYLAGPFFDIAQRWLVEEARDRLVELGATVFSPFHDVGMGGGPDALAAADLAGLDGCDAVLALLDGADPGTIFEVGHARSRGIPVVALAERLGEEHLTMIAGTGCVVSRDLASALYRAVWSSMR